MTKFQKQMMTIAALGALSAVTALPAMAAEITPYGSARLSTFWNMTDTKAGGKTGGYDEHLQGNARLGVNFKDAEFGGKVELGAGTGTAAIRLLYGTWDFGAGKLVVGQDYNRYYTFVSTVARDENVLNGIGSLWDGRQAQLRIDMKNGAYVSFIQPTGNVTAGNQEATNGKEVYLPKVNVGYAAKSGNVSYNVGVVGQTYKHVASDEQVTSALGYVNGAATFGATTLMYNLSYAMNPTEMGFTGRLTRGTLATSDDVTGFEGYLQLTQKLSPTMSANIGLAYVADEGNTGVKDDKYAAYINLPIKLAKSVTFVPEFYYEDQLDETFAGATKTAGKNQTYQIGAKWQIDF